MSQKAIDFKRAAAPSPSPQQASPFSIRFTADERAYLDAKAGNKPLGAYIRDVLLGDYGEKRGSYRKPKTDETQAAAILAERGRSRMPSNLNQLAKAANCGTLDVSEDTEAQLQMACAAVIAMREALFIALGLKPARKETDDDTGGQFTRRC